MATRTIDISSDTLHARSVSDGAALARPSSAIDTFTAQAGLSAHTGVGGSLGAPSMFGAGHSGAADAFSVNLKPGLTVTSSHGPVKIGGGDGPMTNDFGDVHLESDGSHWILTDGVDSVTLIGATAVIIEGQTYRLVDHFGAGEGGNQSIQAAVDAAGDGDIVLVAGGTYTEQVVVNGFSGLTIQALDGDDVNVVAPADVVQHGTSISGRALNGVITVTNSSDVELSGLDVDGAGHGNTVDGASANFLGVVYRNASGGLTDVDITGVRDAYPGGTTTGGNPLVSGVQRGVGLQVDNDSLLSFFMHGGTITDFQKNATVFNFADLDVSGVTVTGGGAQTGQAQNGMQAGNCTGTIADCIISAIGYAGTTGDPSADSYSGAILLTGNNTDLFVQDNTITGANGEDTDAKVVGIFVLDFLGANNGGGVTGNDMSYCDTGVGVFGDIGASGYDVSGNEVTNGDPNDYYVLINPQFGGIDFEPTDSLNVAFNVSGSGAADYLAGAAEGDTLSGQAGADGLHGNDGADILYGGADADDLDGGDGGDTLDGGTGADSMAGGDGDDTYYVDDAGDTETENASEGTDLVYSSVSHTLGANVENLTLTGTGNIDGTGNDLANIITGNSGDNVIDGAGGIDSMIGGDGDDTYHVDESSDGITEASGEGTDLVLASASYTLSANVDNITLVDAADDIQIFDDMALGEISDGENGWTVLAGGRDQEIVDRGGGNYAFRMSSDPGVADFAGPYSPEVSVAAGETASGTGVHSQLIEYDFQAVSTALGDLSRLEVDLGNADGTDRNNFLIIENTDDGIRIAVADPDPSGDFGDAGTFPDDWRELVSGIDNSTEHHLAMRVTYVDGADNDVIQVYLDGQLIGTTTTFENYRDSLGGAHDDNLYTTDRVFFRPSANGAPNDGPGGANQGFYFDNLHVATYNNLDATGNDDNNIITGNSGDNRLYGMDGDDTVNGGVGNDTGYGGAGVDTMSGEDGDDAMVGGAENDILNGNAGQDILDGGDGDDTLDGGDGSNTAGYLSATAAVKVKLGIVGPINTEGAGNDTLINIDNAIGSNFADNLLGSSGANMLAGMADKDRLLGKDGDDTIFGGQGKDRLIGGDGDDTLVGGGGNDTMKGQDDGDSFCFADGFGNDVIKGFDETEDNLVFDAGIAGDIHTVVVGGEGTLVYTDAGDSVLLKNVFVDVSANISIGTCPAGPGDYLI